LRLGLASSFCHDLSIKAPAELTSPFAENARFEARTFRLGVEMGPEEGSEIARGACSCDNRLNHFNALSVRF
jgi:hypothetical protein